MKRIFTVLFIFLVSTSLYAQCWKVVSAGMDHTIAVKPDGTLWAWGFNGSGQLGIGNTDEKNSPTQIGTATNWQIVSAGGNHSFAIKTDGTLWGWGDNFWGQVGVGTYGTEIYTPTKIGTSTNWKSISVGLNFTLGIKTDGTLWAWGENYFGQLGISGQTPSPVKVGVETNWQSVDAGNAHTMAIKTDGTLWGWGFNSYGQLGDGTILEKSTPQRIGSDGNWQSIATGNNFSMALKTDGTLWTWGSNFLGQLGDGTYIDKKTPTQIGNSSWKTISAGNVNSLAIKADGSLWRWGWILGEVGYGIENSDNIPTQLGQGSNWQSISSGDKHSFAFKTDGTLWGWGDYFWGKLGIDGNLDFREPQLVTTPAPIGLATQIFCAAATINDLKAVGTNVNWYLTPIGGTPLPLTTSLLNGNHYYAGNTLSSCESSIRLDVTVSVNLTPTPPPIGLSAQTFCGAATIANLTLIGTNIKWYSSANSVISLSLNTALTNDTHYFATQTITGCESLQRLDVSAFANTTPAPTGSTLQYLCTESKVESLVALGSNIKWYDVPTAGSALDNMIQLKNGSSYYGSQTIGSMESCSRFKIIVSLSSTITPAPTGSSNQIFCENATLENLIAYGTNISWYKENSGGSALPLTTAVVSNSKYYASQTVNFCESPLRLMVDVLINTEPTLPPTGSTTQTLCNGSLVMNLSLNENEIKWYSTEVGGTPLQESIALIDGAHYFASQILNACESLERLEVTTNLLENSTLIPINLKPVPWNSINTSRNFSTSIKEDGTLWGWGINGSRQLMDGTLIAKKIPVQIGTDFNWHMVTSGYSHVLAIKTDGTLWGWGSNGNGQLGIGIVADPLSPRQIGAANNWKIVEAGSYYSIGLKKDGTLWGWGYNFSGILGTGTVGGNRYVVGQIGTDTDWKSVSTSFDGGHVLAIKNDETLWAWGSNFSGELGDGTQINRLVPTKISDNNNWQSISAGSDFSLAIKKDGTLWAWGNNGYGQLGDGTKISKSVPTQIGNSTDWKTVSAGDSHGVAVKTDGTLWAWGSNYGYQIGDGTGNDVSVPAKIGTDTDWESISAGYYQTLAIKKDGTLRAWGYNGYGEVGSGTVEIVSTPKLILSSSQAVCSDATIANLEIGGADLKWYNLPIGGIILPSSTKLINGNHYYVSQTTNFCESANRLDVAISTKGTPSVAPSGSSLQSFCSGAIIADLTAIGNNLKWYLSATGGIELMPETPLVSDNHYFASQTTNLLCESISRFEVTVSSTPSPVGNLIQKFCQGATIENLAASGTNIKWYDSPFGGIPLASTFELRSNSHYYASQEINSCESLTRLEIITKSLLASPLGNASQNFCSKATVANLIAEGANIKWYSSAMGGTPLSSNAAIVDGAHYYGSQSNNSCESATRLDVVATISTSIVPTGNTIQTFCSNATIADLTSTGINLKWYTSKTGGTELASTTTLKNETHYFASQTLNSCESEDRLDVTVIILDETLAPIGIPSQALCAESLISSLSAIGTNIKWYDSVRGGIPLTVGTILTNGSHYYASQTINSCESSSRLDVTVEIIATSTPTGVASQSFCDGAIVNSLVATGSNIKWYATATGGIPLSVTTRLVNGSHYYASQTTNSCESNSRLNVTALINSTAAPGGSSIQSFCSSSTIANLIAYGANIKWYASASGGTPLATTTPLVSGNHYYASQTLNSCESLSRLDATILISVAPTGASTQTFCSSATVANLVVSGAGIKWYTSSTGGTPIAITTALVNGSHYYASQTVNSCESPTRLDVTAFISLTAIPTGASSQNFCQGATVAALSATGTNIKWYANSFGGNQLSLNTLLVNNAQYFATQTLSGCESPTRLIVSVKLNPIPSAPTGASTQFFESGKTISDLVASGTGVKWYGSSNEASTKTNPLPAAQPLVNGTTYFGTQTIGGCESNGSLAVTVSIITGIELGNSLLEYHPNPVKDFLTISVDYQIETVTVINMVGQKVLTKKINDTHINLDMTELESSIYLIYIQSKDKIASFKVMKQ
jgi:alpha-tubulin suppressor-like RCC1 family protein